MEVWFKGRIDKIERTGMGYLLTIYVSKPVTKIEGVTDEEQKEILDKFNKLHIGNCKIKQP